MSTYCPDCVKAKTNLGIDSVEFGIWHKDHTESGQCQQNYFGSANAMEKDAALLLWSRSVKEKGLRYTQMVGDGDARTYAFLNSSKVYDINIEKQECVNH